MGWLETVAAAYKITLELITRSAANAKNFIAARNTIPVYNQFVQQYLKLNPGQNRSQADIAYRLSKFWGDQGKIISKLDPSETVDPRIAQTIEKPILFMPDQGPLRYVVRFNVYFPVTGTSKTFEQYFHTNQQLDLNDIYTQAWDDLTHDWKGTGSPDEKGEDVQAYVTNSVVSFARFIPT